MQRLGRFFQGARFLGGGRAVISRSVPVRSSCCFHQCPPGETMLTWLSHLHGDL